MTDESQDRSADARSTPILLDVPEAASVLGIGRTLAYELVRAGRWPTPVIHVGRLIKIPSQPLIEFVSTGVSTRASTNSEAV